MFTKTVDGTFRMYRLKIPLTVKSKFLYMELMREGNKYSGKISVSDEVFYD